MKRTFWIFAIIMAAIISFHGVANATSIIYDGDNVTKVEDLAISGLGMFNVDFIADTFINLFGSNSQFADQATAIIANQALNAALNEEIPIPARIKFEPGTAIANSNVYGVPYGVPYMQGQRINVQSSFNPTNDVPDSGWGIASGPPLTGFIGTNDEGYFAVFTPVNPVPEPITMLLLGLGLMGLAGVRRKIQK